MGDHKHFSDAPDHQVHDDLDTHSVAAFQGSLIRNQIGHIPRCPALPTDKFSSAQWMRYFTDGWTDLHLWKAAFIEFVAAASLCYLSGMIDVTLLGFNRAQAPAYVGVSNVVLLSLFIMATAPTSGGHINPLITFSTVLTGLTGFSRGKWWCRSVERVSLLTGSAN